MFYSSPDNSGAEAILRGEEVVRATPARVKDLWGYVVLPGEMFVLLKGIASLTGVKSTSPLRSSPLLRLTDISWSFYPADFVLPSFLPSSTLSICFSPYSFFFLESTFVHSFSPLSLTKTSRCTLQSSPSSWTNDCSPGDIPDNLWPRRPTRTSGGIHEIDKFADPMRHRQIVVEYVHDTSLVQQFRRPYVRISLYYLDWRTVILFFLLFELLNMRLNIFLNSYFHPCLNLRHLF